MFYHRLNCALDVLSEPQTQFLFVPRAGFTILKHLNKYRKTKKLSSISDQNLFWVNRIVTTNSIVDDTKYIKTLSSLIGTSNI